MAGVDRIAVLRNKLTELEVLNRQKRLSIIELRDSTNTEVLRLRDKAEQEMDDHRRQLEVMKKEAEQRYAEAMQTIEVIQEQYRQSEATLVSLVDERTLEIERTRTEYNNLRQAQVHRPPVRQVVLPGRQVVGPQGQVFERRAVRDRSIPVRNNVNAVQPAANPPQNAPLARNPMRSFSFEFRGRTVVDENGAARQVGRASYVQRDVDEQGNIKVVEKYASNEP